jgi:predicted branched-subunit amino acid permease
VGRRGSRDALDPAAKSTSKRMLTDQSPAVAPAWTATATQSQAFWQGARLLFSVPCLLLFGTAIGFGALARDVGLTFGNTLFVAVTMVALPNQVVLVDEIARGAAVTAIALAVTLTALRLLPMTVSLMPLMRGSKRRPLAEFVATWPIAITSWIEGMRRLPELPPDLRLAFHYGTCLGMVTSTVTGSLVGYLLAGNLPPILAAALLFMTPIYFLLSLITTSKTLADHAALGLGAVIGPVMFLAVPGFDLMLTGLIAGTAAYVLGHRRG